MPAAFSALECQCIAPIDIDIDLDAVAGGLAFEFVLLSLSRPKISETDGRFFAVSLRGIPFPFTPASPVLFFRLPEFRRPGETEVAVVAAVARVGLVLVQLCIVPLFLRSALLLDFLFYTLSTHFCCFSL